MSLKFFSSSSSSFKYQRFVDEKKIKKLLPPTLCIVDPKTEEDKLFNHLLTFQDKFLAKRFCQFIRQLETDKILCANDIVKIEKELGFFEQWCLTDLMVFAFKKSPVCAYLQHATAKQLKKTHPVPKWLKGCFKQTSLDPFSANLFCPLLHETLYDEASFLVGTLEEYLEANIAKDAKKEDKKRAASKYGEILYLTMCNLFPHSVYYISFRFMLRLRMKEIVRFATNGIVKYNLTCYTHAPKCLCFNCNLL